VAALGTIRFDCAVAGPLVARVRVDARIANYPLLRVVRLDCQVKPTKFVRVAFTAHVANADAAVASEAAVIVPTDEILFVGTPW